MNNYFKLLLCLYNCTSLEFFTLSGVNKIFTTDPMLNLWVNAYDLNYILNDVNPLLILSGSSIPFHFVGHFARHVGHDL